MINSRKIVINGCFGGFNLSKEAKRILREKGILKDVDDYCEYCHRTAPELVEVVENLGGQASTSLSSLYVVEIPDDVDWEIHNYDGVETVHERHRVWG